MRRSLCLAASVIALATAAPPVAAMAADGLLPAPPPLRKSDNVEVLGTVPGSAAGMVFKGTHAFVTGWATGLTVLDISVPASPRPVAALPLPHFENEDVDLCGDTLLISNDRETKDLGSVLYVIDIHEPTRPTVASVLPLGLTGEGRGSGHIANFVTADCTQAWIDGGDHVEVVDLTDPAHPASLGKFESEASKSEAFRVTHDTELDSTGLAWSVGGGGAAAYRPNLDDPLKPTLVTSTDANGTNPSAYNDFILHNTKRTGSTLLVTEEDYVDTDEAQPGSCNGQGRFETWRIGTGPGATTPLDTWQTELNGFVVGGADDSKAPVTANCSSHWFEERDKVAAVGWYEQGVRLLDVHNPKDIRQIGYYLPANGSTWAAYWVPGAKDIVYTADVYRGIDVLRVTNAAQADTAPTVTAPILDEWFGARQGVAGFTPSTRFGWACALPTD